MPWSLDTPILMNDVGGKRMAAYNGDMQPAGTDLGQHASNHGAMSDAVVDVLGTLLAVVGRILDGKAMLRRGGPGIVRRLASIISAFIAFVVALVVQRRAIGGQSVVTIAGSKTLRHLRRPPQGWAAP